MTAPSICVHPMIVPSRCHSPDRQYPASVRIGSSVLRFAPPIAREFESLPRVTAHHRPWSLVVSLEFTDATTAARFERYVKTGSGRAFAKQHFGGFWRPRR